MIPGAAIYTQERKARHSTEAMVKGFPAARFTTEPAKLAPGYHLHIFGGLQFGCLELMRQAWHSRPDFIFWDRAYFGGGTQTNLLRVVMNDYHARHVKEGLKLDRFHAFGGRLEPWRGPGRHVMVVPPSEAIGSLWSGAPAKWEADIVGWLKRCTDREIRVSYKGDRVPLPERLRDCHAVVTWSSNVAVEAICAGVPAYVSNMSAALAVANDLACVYNGTGIEEPKRPDREAWAASLAWRQFTLEEIAGGMARALVMEKG